MSKNFYLFLLLPFLLSGCLTIHNLNVSGDSSEALQQEPYAINTMEGFEETSAERRSLVDQGGNTPEPMGVMGGPEAPPALSLAFANPSYRLQPGDALDVKFFYNQELNESVLVRPDGRISLQLVHDVQAASLSPNELVAVLEKKYSTHLKEPEISVIVRSMEANKVFVDGQVYRAGEVPMLGNMSILQSIASAGGMKNSARGKEVLLIRRNGLKRPFVYLVNLDAALNGSDISQDVMLRPSDIVYVPKSAIANINTWVDMYIRQNIPIEVGLESIKIR